MQFTVVMIPRFFIIYHVHSINIQREDSNSHTDSDVSRALSQASRGKHAQLSIEEKGQRYQECSGEK